MYSVYIVPPLSFDGTLRTLPNEKESPRYNAALWKLSLLFLMLFWSNTGRKERRHGAGVEYMLGSILKTSKNNKLSVLEVLKLGKSYN